MVIAADFRGLPWLVRRILPRKEPLHARAVSTTVALAEEVPWAAALAVEIRGFPR